MTPDEQEALSHQHSHGFWCVPLESFGYAIFDRPGGKLLKIISADDEDCLHYEGTEAFERYTKAMQPLDHKPLNQLDLTGIDI